MIDIIDRILKFLLDESKRLFPKAALLLFLLGTVFLINDTLGLSYFYNKDKKIEEVSKLNLIIKDSTSDKTTKIFALKLRNEILEREDLITKSINWISNINSYNKQNKSEIDKSELIVRSFFWFHATAGGIYYLLAFIIIPIMVVTDKDNSFLQRFATGVLSAALFFGFGYLFYLLCNFIPQISRTIWWPNYIINLIVQGSITTLLFYVGFKNK